MNNLVAIKIQEFEKINNRFERNTKVNNACEFIIQYYSAVLYSVARNRNLINKQIVEIILTDFYKKNPLIGNWIKLLKASLDLLKINPNVDPVQGQKLQELSIKILGISNKKKINMSPTFRDVLDSISIIRNKVFAHSQAISQTDLDTLASFSYDRVPYLLESVFSSIVQYRIILMDNVIRTACEDCRVEVQDYTSDIIKVDVLTIDFSDELYSNSFYLLFENEFL